MSGKDGNWKASNCIQLRIVICAAIHCQLNLLQVTLLSNVISVENCSTLSSLGHGVASFPNRVLYSHTGLVGTTEDLSSQMTKVEVMKI